MDAASNLNPPMSQAEFEAAIEAMTFDILQVVETERAAIALPALVRAQAHIIATCFPPTEIFKKIEVSGALLPLLVARNLNLNPSAPPAKGG